MWRCPEVIRSPKNIYKNIYKRSSSLFGRSNLSDEQEYCYLGLFTVKTIPFFPQLYYAFITPLRKIIKTGLKLRASLRELVDHQKGM